MPPTSVGWASSLTAVTTMARRLSELIRSITDAGVPALGTWNAGQVGAHMTHVFEIDLGLLRGEPSPLADLERLSSLTEARMRAEGPELDMPAVALRIERGAEAFLAEAAVLGGDEVRTWLGGADLPVTALACHIVSEGMLHGLDLAAATGRPWPMARSDASHAFLGFICPMLAALGQPAYAVDQQGAAGLRACFDLRLRGGGRVFFVFADGALTVEQPSDRRVDCHLWMDPRAVMLLAWGRGTLVSTIARGQVVPWGRRPWLAPRFPGLFRTP